MGFARIFSLLLAQFWITSGWVESGSAKRLAAHCNPFPRQSSSISTRCENVGKTGQSIVTIDEEPHYYDEECSLSHRRAFLNEMGKLIMITGSTTICSRSSAVADDQEGFVSAGFVRSEYTNSIVASRDTNISPKEVYDSILSLRDKVQKKQGDMTALDVGAGAGVSTQTLYQMGFTNIDALDWSRDAWDLNVVENGHCPDTVHFYNVDDERFLQLWRKMISNKYDVIVFNFAVNSEKAMQFATELLKMDGVLLAPVNNQKDYWLKQSFQVFNAQGKLLSSTSDVGAWSVQFQPDVTQDTCQGIWCPPFNGFQKQQ